MALINRWAIKLDTQIEIGVNDDQMFIQWFVLILWFGSPSPPAFAASEQILLFPSSGSLSACLKAPTGFPLACMQSMRRCVPLIQGEIL